MSEAPNPDNLVELAPGVTLRKRSLRYRFDRSGGPGGQAVNKINTKATLRVAIEDIDGLTEGARRRLRRLAGRRLNNDDELILQAESSRSQLDNRQACLDALCELVQVAIIPPKPRKKKKVSRAAKQRRLNEKKQKSEKKRDRRPPPHD